MNVPTSFPISFSLIKIFKKEQYRFSQIEYIFSRADNESLLSSKGPNDFLLPFQTT